MSLALLKQLSNCDLKTAAFNLVKGLEGGVYKKEMAAALDLFTKLPCPETAVNLVAICPDTLPLMISADDSFIRMTPKEHRGTAIQGFEEWEASFEANLEAVVKIHGFLLKEAGADRVSVGFHRTRDQEPLFQRLERIGIKKGIFANRRQFLRDTVTKNLSSFRAVIDMICIHGVHEGHEKFLDGLGVESNSQLYLQSEIFYNIGQVISEFFCLLKELNRKFAQPQL